MATIVIIFSSDAEWRAARKYRKVTFVEETPYGECFAMLEGERTTIYLQGGWGKISAAASAQSHLAPGRTRPAAPTRNFSCPSAARRRFNGWR